MLESGKFYIIALTSSLLKMYIVFQPSQLNLTHHCQRHMVLRSRWASGRWTSIQLLLASKSDTFRPHYWQSSIWMSSTSRRTNHQMFPVSGFCSTFCELSHWVSSLLAPSPQISSTPQSNRPSRVVTFSKCYFAFYRFFGMLIMFICSIPSSPRSHLSGGFQARAGG
jgi:hypothetical protein